MQEFKRENYIYLRYLEDDKENSKKKGDIVRYCKDWLLDKMEGRRFTTCFKNDALILEKNHDVDEDEIMFNKVYKSITVSKDCRGQVYLWNDDYLYLGDWLFSHLDERGIDLVTSLQSDVLPNKMNSNKLIKLNKGCPEVNARINLYFNKGEQIDFSIPDVAILFCDPCWIKLFAKTEVIVGKEKEQLFQEDFSNAIYGSAVNDFEFSSSYPKEHHYFKMKNNIKIKTLEEISKALEISYSNLSSLEIVKNEEGFITHICTVTNDFDNSDRNTEQSILKIADRVSTTEALEIHKKACQDYMKKQKQEQEKMSNEYEEMQKKINAQYQKVKNNPEIFPGVNGDFVHTNNNSAISTKQYNLKKIKEFYQQLKSLDSEVVKHICFYGGTIPYILNNASESRHFGDIDMFVPTKYMENLRKEFANQESFEMLCDSKPYAEACMLTTRIAKESIQFAVANQQDNLTQALLGNIISFMTPREYKKDYVDENGIVHNPLTEHKEDLLPYYRKIQDFGFKAKLFGINISVFPIYEYENNIMAKSFNINDMYKFLLGVRVLDNTKLAEFIKQVNVYDSVFNILPLEYTLASKQRAVDEKHAYRYEKDAKDIEYILSHRTELGINDKQLQEILNNYPDYSISVAYRINDNGTTTTMNGESYKALVLSNRNIIS